MTMRKALYSMLAICLVISLPLAGRPQGFHDELLDKLEGEWIMTGIIAGQEITHDLKAEWVLGHNYLKMYELSREHDEHGVPAYEAIVFIGRDDVNGGYACMWLDITGPGGLRGDALGHAPSDGDKIPFVFKNPAGGFIHNTFSYDGETDTWRWEIDSESGGERREFARVKLERK
jgi:hypothetical protein